MTKDEALRLALEALEMLARYENPETKIQIRKPKDGGQIVTMYPHKVATEAAEAIKAALEAKDETVAWSEDFDAMPFNTYCKAIVDWYSHSRDGDSFLEGRDVEVIVVKYESGKGEYDTVFIHEGNKQYAYTRCEVSKWKPLYAHPFKE